MSDFSKYIEKQMKDPEFRAEHEAKRKCSLKGGKYMAEEELRQDTRTVEQIVDDMSLFDDDLMSMVFDGNIGATEIMLKIILKRGDILVESVVGQREFQNPVV